jgi:hypothetical protein
MDRYYDGHCRADVVQARVEYLARQLATDENSLPPMPSAEEKDLDVAPPPAPVYYPAYSPEQNPSEPIFAKAIAKKDVAAESKQFIEPKSKGE